MTDELRMDRIGPLSPPEHDEIVAIFPKDDLKTKRARNLSRASYVLVARADSGIAGVVFVRRVLGVPNMTWVVAEAHRGKGIATALVRRAQQDLALITAICRNPASRRVARKAGLLLVPPGIGVWARVRP